MDQLITNVATLYFLFTNPWSMLAVGSGIRNDALWSGAGKRLLAGNSVKGLFGVRKDEGSGKEAGKGEASLLLNSAGIATVIYHALFPFAPFLDTFPALLGMHDFLIKSHRIRNYC